MITKQIEIVVEVELGAREGGGIQGTMHRTIMVVRMRVIGR